MNRVWQAFGNDDTPGVHRGVSWSQAGWDDEACRKNETHDGIISITMTLYGDEPDGSYYLQVAALDEESARAGYARVRRAVNLAKVWA